MCQPHRTAGLPLRWKERLNRVETGTTSPLPPGKQICGWRAIGEDEGIARKSFSGWRGSLTPSTGVLPCEAAGFAPQRTEFIRFLPQRSHWSVPARILQVGACDRYCLLLRRYPLKAEMFV